MCETDFSGYPDCRDDTLKALQVALNLGMEQRFVVETPLMWIDKAQTLALADEIGGDRTGDLIAPEHRIPATWATAAPLHDWGYGCGTCPACELRSQGWLRYVADTRG